MFIRFLLFAVAIVVSSAFIFAFALIGVGSAPFIPLMLFCGVGWMRIAMDVSDLLRLRSLDAAPSSSRTRVQLQDASSSAM